MAEPARDRWLAIGMSVLLHGAIIGLLGYSWWRYAHRPITPSVSLEATVVDAHALKGEGLAPKPAPKPPAPPPVSAPQGPPAPTPQEQALRQQAAEAEQQRLAAAQAEQQRLKQQRAAQAKVRAREHAKAQAEAQAKAKALAEAKARAEAKQRAEQRRKRAAAQKLAAARKLAAERAAKARAERIAQLQQAFQEDAQSNAQMRAAQAGWVSEVTQRVEAAWIKPSTARSNLSCTIRVVLVPGGAVSSVSLGQCNGDEAVRESIEAAVYRASPLPPPPDPQLYHQSINFLFAPHSN